MSDKICGENFLQEVFPTPLSKLSCQGYQTASIVCTLTVTALDSSQAPPRPCLLTDAAA